MAAQDFTYRDADHAIEPTEGYSVRTAAIRDRLAPGACEAQLALVDGPALTGWLTSPGAFDAALAQVLQRHPRQHVRVQVEEAL